MHWESDIRTHSFADSESDFRTPSFFDIGSPTFGLLDTAIIITYILAVPPVLGREEKSFPPIFAYGCMHVCLFVCLYPRQQKFRAMNGAHLASPIRGELGYAH